MIILGKHSGSHAIKHRLEEYGIHVTDDQLIRIAGDMTKTRPDPFALVDLHVHAGTQRARSATVTIRDNERGQDHSYIAMGEGPLEAVIHAIGQAIPVAVEFEDLELHSLSTGEGAYGEAVVSIIHNGKSYRGTSIHKDIILASAEAYILGMQPSHDDSRPQQGGGRVRTAN